MQRGRHAGFARLSASLIATLSILTGVLAAEPPAHALVLYHFTGTVADANGTPLAAATVTDGGQFVTTDANGHYSLGESSTGGFDLTAYRSDTQQQTQVVNVIVPVDTTVNFTLLYLISGSLPAGALTTAVGPASTVLTISSWAPTSSTAPVCVYVTDSDTHDTSQATYQSTTNGASTYTWDLIVPLGTAEGTYTLSFFAADCPPPGAPPFPLTPPGTTVSGTNTTTYVVNNSATSITKLVPADFGNTVFGSQPLEATITNSGPAGINPSSIRFTLTDTSASPPASATYGAASYDGSSGIAKTSPVTLTQGDVYTMSVTASDTAGNNATATMHDPSAGGGFSLIPPLVAQATHASIPATTCQVAPAALGSVFTTATCTDVPLRYEDTSITWAASHRAAGLGFADETAALNGAVITTNAVPAPLNSQSAYNASDPAWAPKTFGMPYWVPATVTTSTMFDVPKHTATILKLTVQVPASWGGQTATLSMPAVATTNPEPDNLCADPGASSCTPDPLSSPCRITLSPGTTDVAATAANQAALYGLDVQNVDAAHDAYTVAGAAQSSLAEVAADPATQSVVPTPDDAQAQNVNIPKTLACPASYDASITMQNTGLSTWLSPVYAFQVATEVSGSGITPIDNPTTIPVKGTVTPGQSQEFDFTIDTSQLPRKALTETIHATMVNTATGQAFGTPVNATVSLPCAPFTVSLSTSPASAAIGDTVTLTATANQTVSGTGYVIGIYDAGSGVLVGSCTTGSACSVPVSESVQARRTFLAYVGNSSGTAPPPNEQAVSPSVTVTWSGYVVTLQTSNASPQQTQTFTLSATSSAPVDGTGYVLEIFNQSTGYQSTSCSSGSTCSITYMVSTQRCDTYIAYVATQSVYNPPPNIQGQSGTVTETSMGGCSSTPFTVSLAASNTSPAVNSSVTLTATASRDVGSTGYDIEIFDTTTGAQVTYCTSGTTCNGSVSQFTASTHTYEAYVAEFGYTNPPPGIQASSSTVTVTWGGASTTSLGVREVSGTMLGQLFNGQAHVTADYGFNAPTQIDTGQAETSTIQLPSGTYVMFYRTFVNKPCAGKVPTGISYLTSLDGSTWSTPSFGPAATGAPLFDGPNGAGSSISNGTGSYIADYAPSAIVDTDASGHQRITLTFESGTVNVQSKGSCTFSPDFTNGQPTGQNVKRVYGSLDLSTWSGDQVVVPQNPNNSWESYNTGTPGLVRTSDGRYYVTYHGYDGTNGDNAFHRGVTSATTLDQQMPDGTVIINPNSTYASAGPGRGDLVHENGYWYQVVEGLSNTAGCGNSEFSSWNLYRTPDANFPYGWQPSPDNPIRIDRVQANCGEDLPAFEVVGGTAYFITSVADLAQVNPPLDPTGTPITSLVRRYTIASGARPAVPGRVTVAGSARTSDGLGYYEAYSNGTIASFGDAPNVSISGSPSNVVGMALDSTGNGGWLADSKGGVYTFGDASFYNSLPGENISVSNIVGIAPTSDGAGYWLVGSDGAVYSFGDAQYKGGENTSQHNGTIVGITAATPSGQANTSSYWLAGSDGGVYTFGSAGFYGSAVSCATSPAIVALVATPSAGGYWLLRQDGAVYASACSSPSQAFGNVTFEGSTAPFGSPGNPEFLPYPAVSGMTTTGGGGDWVVERDGGVLELGSARFFGDPHYSDNTA